MRRRRETQAEWRRLVAELLELFPGTSRSETETIARRMLDDPDGDLLDQLTL